MAKERLSMYAKSETIKTIKMIAIAEGKTYTTKFEEILQEYIDKRVK